MRYEVIRESVTGHCCFEASVVDVEIRRKEGLPGSGVLCECFEVKDAEKICEVLNRTADDGK